MSHTVHVHVPTHRKPSRRGLLVALAVVLPLLLVAAGVVRTSGSSLPAVPAAAPAAADAPVLGPRLPTGAPLEPVAAAPMPLADVVPLVSGGRKRAVLALDPPRHLRATALLVVLGPHALTASRTSDDVRFDDLRRRGWAVAYPSTLDGDWNAGRCCGSPQKQGIDDVGFLQDTRAAMLARYDLDPSDVALVGYSTGGQMAYRLACERPDYARALLVVAGSLETDCAPASPLPPTLVVHGLADATIPWEVSIGRTAFLDHAPSPALSSIAGYAAAGGCGAREENGSDGRVLVRWASCARMASLTLAGMPATGHGWTPLGGSLYAARFLPPYVAEG